MEVYIRLPMFRSGEVPAHKLSAAEEDEQTRNLTEACYLQGEQYTMPMAACDLMKYFVCSLVF